MRKMYENSEVNQEILEKWTIYKDPIFYYQSFENFMINLVGKCKNIIGN